LSLILKAIATHIGDNMWSEPTNIETYKLEGFIIECGWATYCGGQVAGTTPFMCRILADNYPSTWFKSPQAYCSPYRIKRWLEANPTHIPDSIALVCYETYWRKNCDHITHHSSLL